MTTIVFSIMSIESFINNYGIENFSRKYFDNYLDKLDIKSKWIIYPKLITGKQIDTNSQAFELLGNMITLRNRLVHDKTRKKPVSELTTSDWINEFDAKESVDAVQKLVEELAKLDKNIDTEWIEPKFNATECIEEFKKLTAKQQNILKNWINTNLKKIKGINIRHSSYEYKHFFEHDRKSGHFYINHGQFKGAMLECGFKSGTNWNFNVSERSVTDLYKRGVEPLG